MLLKKSIIIGLFFAGLACLQYQQIANIHWDRLQANSQNALTTPANATTQISNHINNIAESSNHTTSTLARTNFGIPLTGCMAMGFALGYMKVRLMKFIEGVKISLCSKN